MKSVTEFWNHALLPAIQAKTALAAEGKTPEEVLTSLGEKYKFEGDKLKHFVNAIEVAGANLEKLSRIVVVTLTEGESAPPKSVKVEDFYYLPEFQTAPKPVQTKKADARGPGGGKGRGGGGGGKDRGSAPKTSPWGLTPEEKAAKKAGGKVAKT